RRQRHRTGQCRGARYPLGRDADRQTRLPRSGATRRTGNQTQGALGRITDLGGYKMKRNRPTVADLRAMKGKKQLTMLRVLTLDEAEAAEKAGIDIVSVPPELVTDPRYREVAPTLFTMPGENFFEIGTGDDFVRWAFRMYKAGADAVYCSASYATIKRMADEAIPVIGHVGLIPSRRTWTGGFKAV